MVGDPPTVIGRLRVLRAYVGFEEVTKTAHPLKSLGTTLRV